MPTFMKSGQPWLYDSDSGDIVGARDGDGGDMYFARLASDAKGNATGLVGPDGRNRFNGSSIVGAHRIRKMLGAIGQSSYRRVNIGYHSHSIGVGVSAGDSGTYNAAAFTLFESRGQAAIIAKILSAAYGGSGTTAGFAMGGTSSGVNPLLTMGGGAGAPSGSSPFFGPSGWTATLSSAAHTLAFTAVGAYARVYCAAGGAGSTIAARWNAPSVSGGATQTATLPAESPNPGNTPAGDRTWYEFTIGPVVAGETVTIMAPTSSSIRIYYVDTNYLPDTAGVSVHRLARPGAMLTGLHGASLDATDTLGPASSWIGTDASANGLIRAGQKASMSVRVPQDGIILQTDVNDMNSYLTYGYSLADQKRHLANYLTYHAGLSLPVLCVFGPIRDPALNDAGTPYTQDELIAAYKETVDASTNGAYIDLTAEWPGGTTQARYEAEYASGLLYDTVHPSAYGHGYFGSWIAQSILSAASGAMR